MKLIINTSTLSSTGVTQVAVSFINECAKFSENNEFHVFLSPIVSTQIDRKKFDSNFKFYLIESHPLYGLKGFKIRRKLRKIEQEIDPDCVFTVYGPSCWTPSKPHLIGFANSHFVYDDSPFFKIISLREKFRNYILREAHRFFLKRNGNYYVCETEDMSFHLARFLDISPENIYTVSNTFNNYFLDGSFDSPILPNKKEEFRFLSLCSFMPHKNLTILNRLVPLLKKQTKRDFKFYLTVDSNDYKSKILPEVQEYVINLGRIDVQLCPQLYKECDVLFLPTLLESFTANYPEAMSMGRPILTSDLSFARDICGDAAIFFDPLNPEDICEKIVELMENDKLYDELIALGKARLYRFGTAEQRAEKYLSICRYICNNPCG